MRALAGRIELFCQLLGSKYRVHGGTATSSGKEVARSKWNAVFSDDRTTPYITCRRFIVGMSSHHLFELASKSVLKCIGTSMTDSDIHADNRTDEGLSIRPAESKIRTNVFTIEKTFLLHDIREPELLPEGASIKVSF